ncbi:MAG: hypothetical protein AABZ41_03895 [Bacteroidota bacterium]
MRLFIVTCAWVLSASPLFSQLLSTRISRQHWGLGSFSDIRFGRLSIVHEPTGDQLAVSTLRDIFPASARASTKSASPGDGAPLFIVSHFDGGVRNELGGVFNSFAREPSSAAASIWDRMGARPALRLEFDKREAGFCGMWVHLFNSTAPLESRVYLDASPFDFISFWIRGTSEGEKIRFKLADASWELKEDAVEVGELSRFLPFGSITTDWQRAVIPLANLPDEIRKNELAAISFEVVSSGKGAVEVKTLAFCRDMASLPPLPPLRQTTEQLRAFDKALWVWNTDDIFKDRAKQSKLFNLLEKQNFNHIFLALPYRLSSSRDSGIVIDEKRFRPLLSRLNKMGINVHALIGDKDFIFPEQRAFVTATLENIISFNSRSKPVERFYGIHLDVEPYLLPGFNGTRQDWILANFVGVLEHVSVIAKRANLFTGADIPFWLDVPDEFTGDYLRVNINGTPRRIIDHIIDIMDLVVLMSYRTVADGADGIIMHSSGEIEYAEENGKQVLVGLETHSLPDEDAMTFRGEPTKGLPQNESSTTLVLSPSDDSAMVWLVQPGQFDLFRSFVKTQNIASSSVLSWQVSKSVPVRGDKLSFAKHGIDALDRVMMQSQAGLKDVKSFRGFAIHHFQSFLPMFERSRR